MYIVDVNSPFKLGATIAVTSLVTFFASRYLVRKATDLVLPSN